MADAVRALDSAGVEIHHMELNAPSLDDVFAEATGRRLEGASDDEAPIDEGPAPVPEAHPIAAPLPEDL
jgi:hypothetical protein